MRHETAHMSFSSPSETREFPNGRAELLSSEGMTVRRVRVLTCAVILLAAVSVTVVTTPSAASEQPNVVVRWNEVALSFIVDDGASRQGSTRTPSAAALYVGMVQAAVYNATMAIEGSHTLYRSSLSAAPGASVDAAVAVAAHDVLAEYYTTTAQRERLANALEVDLAQIVDGPAKEAGIQVGRAAAAEVIASRANDGRFASVPSPPDGVEPGQWRRTAGPAAVTPWTAHVRPFLVNAADQFRPDGPNRLTGDDYAEQFEEVRLYGAIDSPVRTEEQTEIARFWTDNTVSQFNRAFRSLAVERGLSVGDTARLFAVTALTGADAMISCWDAKYHYLSWRPVTAIRLAGGDGNPATTADATWVPFSPTANHPEYTSGHACLTGAVSHALSEFLGTTDIELTMDSAIPNTSPRHFDTASDLRVEVENARIYGGDHFRVGGSDGTRAGEHVARWAIKRNFRPA